MVKKNTCKKGYINLGLLLLVVTMVLVPQASAYSSYVAPLRSVYGSNVGSCEVCHIDPNGGGARTVYGKAFEAQPNHKTNPTAALKVIGAPGGTVTVVSPNGAENWKVGTVHTITWKKTGSTGTNVKIELLKGAATQTILASTPNDGSQSWTIPPGQLLGMLYKIRITTNTGKTDSSNNYFTISNGKITVTSPNGGENWKRGTVHMLTWTTSGFAGPNVKIELLKSGVVKQTIAANTANDGSQTWTVPNVLPIGSDYKLRITSTNNVAYADLSNSNFGIS